MAHRVLAAAAFAALLALPMTGCGATAVRTETMATGESALTIGSLSLNPSSETKDRLLMERLEEENAHQRMEQLTQTLDAFCAVQPGSFSVYLQDLTSGEEYTYQADTLYYPASTLKAPYALWLCQRDDAGEIDLDAELPNQFQGSMAGTALESFNDSATVPARPQRRADSPIFLHGWDFPPPTPVPSHRNAVFWAWQALPIWDTSWRNCICILIREPRTRNI